MAMSFFHIYFNFYLERSYVQTRLTHVGCNSAFSDDGNWVIEYIVIRTHRIITSARFSRLQLRHFGQLNEIFCDTEHSIESTLSRADE